MQDQGAAQSFQSSVKKSSGPRTRQGKQRSKYNALKHGMFSTAVLLPGESQSEYKELLRGFFKHWQPVGRYEEALVEQLAAIYWRHRRCVTAEGAEIRQGSEFVEWDHNQQAQSKLDRQMACWEEFNERKEEGGECECETSPFPISRPRHIVPNPIAIRACLELFRDLRAKIKLSGFEKERDVAILSQIDELDSYLGNKFLNQYFYTYKIANLPESERGDFMSPEENRDAFISILDNEIRDCQGILMEADRIKLEALRHIIPDPGRLDRLMRYETNLNKSFDRIVNLLDRAKSQRLVRRTISL